MLFKKPCNYGISLVNSKIVKKHKYATFENRWYGISSSRYMNVQSLNINSTEPNC